MIQFSENLAYWIGIVQSDGSFKTYMDKSRNYKRFIISMGVGNKSFPMLQKFQKISSEILKRNGGIFKSHIGWESKIQVKNLLKEFEKLDINFKDPPKPPYWVMTSNRFFGAYVAGLIDGDGNITVKRPQYPQCSIRISNSCKQEDLELAIESTLKCKAHITIDSSKKKMRERTYYGTCFNLEFYVSSKNYNFIKEFVLPHIVLEYKKKRIEFYIESRWPSWRSLAA